MVQTVSHLKKHLKDPPEWWEVPTGSYAKLSALDGAKTLASWKHS